MLCQYTQIGQACFPSFYPSLYVFYYRWILPFQQITLCLSTFRHPSIIPLRILSVHQQLAHLQQMISALLSNIERPCWCITAITKKIIILNSMNIRGRTCERNKMWCDMLPETLLDNGLRSPNNNTGLPRTRGSLCLSPVTGTSVVDNKRRSWCGTPSSQTHQYVSRRYGELGHFKPR